MTQEEILSIKRSMEKAEKDDTPFAVVNDGEVTVVGDPNKTQKKEVTCAILFRIPVEYGKLLDDVKLSSDGRFYLAEVEYKAMTVTPRKEIVYKGKMLSILNFVKAMKDDGEIETIDDKTFVNLFYMYPEQMSFAIYDFVGEFLNIPVEIRDMMEDVSVISAFNDILESFPEIYNGADLFFG